MLVLKFICFHFRFDCETLHGLNRLFLPSACEKAAGSSMWIYVFLGNMLRGIGETPIMPLGVSYLDDYSRPENTPFYLGLLFSLMFNSILPCLGFLVFYCRVLFSFHTCFFLIFAVPSYRCISKCLNILKKLLFILFFLICTSCPGGNQLIRV